nr:hypothetical protein [Tanacetum cinerariifolium]
SDEELEAPMKDQPLPTDASPTALLPGYIDDSNLEEEEEDLEEDPVDYPANGGDNDDNESSDDLRIQRHLKLMSLLLHYPPLHTISSCFF